MSVAVIVLTTADSTPDSCGGHLWPMNQEQLVDELVDLVVDDVTDLVEDLEEPESGGRGRAGANAPRPFPAPPPPSSWTSHDPTAKPGQGRQSERSERPLTRRCQKWPQPEPSRRSPATAGSGGPSRPPFGGSEATDPGASAASDQQPTAEPLVAQPE